LVPDTLLLENSSKPDSVELYFQGTAMVAGLACGDGLRGAGGAVLRLRTSLTQGGTCSCPAPGEGSLSQRDAVQPPRLRHHQVWCRNAAAYCTPRTLNLWYALTVPWGECCELDTRRA
jgi:hypothetical protein